MSCPSNNNNNHNNNNNNLYYWLFHIKYGFQKGSQNTIRKDVKNLKYVKTIKMYKILTEIDLNYKFKKITFKNIQNHGLTDCLAKGVKILVGMKFI